MTRWLSGAVVAVGTLGAAGSLRAQAVPAAAEWPVYGHDGHGTRYSPLTQINPTNVAQLQVAWIYRTGDTDPARRTRSETSFEATPIVVDATMYVSTPLGRVIALDPTNGHERWTFDPAIDRNVTYGDFTNRGVATWLDPEAAAGTVCRRRIFAAPIDGRLIALDATTGNPCSDFGVGGTVDLKRGLRIEPFEPAAYEITSPPVVVNGIVAVGSAIADNSNPAPASGEVRAFDARTGNLRWSWDPIPQDSADPAIATWQDDAARKTGAANVWSIMVADSASDLLLLPTSSPAPDYAGQLRLGSNRYANSIVALRASTGDVVWDFQTVHHDLWDYDVAAPPALVTLTRNGQRVPAVAQVSKTGMLYVLQRETGKPLFAIEERAVPQSNVPGEEAWPTQPFTTEIRPLSPQRFTADDVWGPTPAAIEACRAMVQGLRSEGIFTPPSLEGTIVVPSNIGGAHWGGMAYDVAHEIAVVPVNRIVAMVQLLAAEGFDWRGARAESDREGLGYEYTRMNGTPYVMRRRFLLANGLPCSPPPFGALVAVSLRTGEKLWEVPLGNMSAEVPAGLGSPNLGGPIVTAGGLVFVGAALDRAIRAYDIRSGEERWKAALPAGGKATPMTYLAGGRQYVVIAAGGGGRFGAGDYLVAFALP